MSIGEDIAYQMSLVRRLKEESDEQLAERLYMIQMDVYSANVGYDIVPNTSYDPFKFKNLGLKTRELWIEKAKTY